MKTLSTLANTQRFLDAPQLLWLIDATFDQYGLADVLRYYGSKQYDLGAITYQDLLTEDGLQLEFSRLESRGGLASIAGFSIVLLDEEGESDIADTYVLANDEVVVYQQFVTGSEVAGDRIEIARGVIDRHQAHRNRWTLSLISGAAKTLRKVPTELINSLRYPQSPEQGQVLPVAFGEFATGPGVGEGLKPILAPYRCIDLLGLRFVAGLQNKAHSTVYQWYAQARRFAQVLTTSFSSQILTASDPARKMIIRPVRAKTGNNVAGWTSAADNDTSTGATLVPGSQLYVWFGGTPKLGSLTALSVEIAGTGSYTYSIYLDTTLISGPTAGSGNTSISLTPVADYEGWDFSLLNVQITGPGSGSSTVSEIYLDVRFNDFQSIEGTAPQLFGKVEGWADTVSYYADGGAVYSANARLDNPVHQLQAMLRGATLHGRPVGEINTTALGAAATSRDGWKFSFVLDRPVEKAFLDTFGLQAGLHIFHDEGKWTVAALDKSRAPQHFFHGNYHMPVADAEDPPETWIHDLQVEPVSTQDIVNEFALRYRRHPATGAYQDSEIASGQYRFSGTCQVLADTQKLVSGDVNFVTEDVAMGERIYVAGDQDYFVDAIDSSGQLSISTVSGGAVAEVAAGTTFYLGPNLDGRMLRSQLTFKTLNALGVRQEIFTDEGGFESDLIVDPDTAALLREHVVEWFSQPRRKVGFPVYHSALNVQLGDVLMLQHAKLPPSRQAVALVTVAGGLTAGGGTLTVPAGTGGLIREDDFLFSWSSIAKKPEVFQVDSADYPNDQFGISRGLLNTEAVAHAAGDPVYRLTVKWMVTGIRPMTPNDPFIRIEAEEMPNSYRPVGRIAPAGTLGYRNESEANQTRYGYVTNHAGRIVEEKEDSATSYVGPAVTA